MDNYKPNSHKYKAEVKELAADKKVEKVVSGGVKTKKKTGVQKFSDVFIPEDINDVKRYIFTDVLIPAGKKLISEIVDALLYGASGQRPKSTASKVGYWTGVNGKNEINRVSTTPRTSAYDYDNLVFESRADAMEVISRMEEMVDTYGMVSVADMYDMAGVTCDYTGNKYGWTSVRTAEPIRVRDGYVIKLPKALPIN